MLSCARYLRSSGYSLRAIMQELKEYGYKISYSTLQRLFKDHPSTYLGKVVGKLNLPYGLKYELDNKTLKACTYEQEIITLICQLKAEGFSSGQIKKELVLKNYTNRAKKPFTTSQIDRIFKKRETEKVIFLLKGNTHESPQETL
jgi:hypothetical protein